MCSHSKDVVFLFCRLRTELRHNGLSESLLCSASCDRCFPSVLHRRVKPTGLVLWTTASLLGKLDSGLTCTLGTVEQ